MKRITALAAASVFASSAAVVTAPAVHAQAAEAMTEAQAEQVARSLDHSTLDAAVEAGDIVAIEGGYALTSSGVSAASASGLLVSPALIPIAAGFAVAVIGLGVVAVVDDDSVATQTPPQTPPVTPPVTTPGTPSS